MSAVPVSSASLFSLDTSSTDKVVMTFFLSSGNFVAALLSSSSFYYGFSRTVLADFDLSSLLTGTLLIWIFFGVTILSLA